MPPRWSYRYSSCEMMYIEIIEPTASSRGEVRTYLDHSPHTAERFSFDEVLAGKLDGEMRNQIGPASADELKAAVREVMAAPMLTPKERNRQEMLRRRVEASSQPISRDQEHSA